MLLKKEQFIEVVKYTPLVAIDLVVRDRHGRVLLGLRKNEPAKGSWFVPGGRILKDESIAAAFSRISRTELGIGQAVQNARFIGVFEHLYPTNFLEEAGFGTHYIVLAYELTLAKTLSTLPAEQHDQYQWLDVVTLLRTPEVHQNTKAYFRTESAGHLVSQ